MQTRRRFLRTFSLAGSSALLLPKTFGDEPKPAASNAVSFFLVGDTHYRANLEGTPQMDPTSAEYNARLVQWLNKLPGTPLPDEIGGGVVPQPAGIIHAGDCVDSGDKGVTKQKVAEAEWQSFAADWGLNGNDGKLRWPVREICGNHDSPHGDGPILSAIIERNKRRAGLTNLSANGLHYSWDWNGVHFVALGLVVGDAPEVTRKRRYAPMGSLPFLRQDLEQCVGKSGRPVVLVHHVDVHRYSAEVPVEKALQSEWDFADVHAFHTTIKPYRIAATMCGHTHARNIVRWNGTKDQRAAEGIPFLNTDNAGHFASPSQAFLQVSITASGVKVNEFATKDGWETASWSPQSWSFPLAV